VNRDKLGRQQSSLRLINGASFQIDKSNFPPSGCSSTGIDLTSRGLDTVPGGLIFVKGVSAADNVFCKWPGELNQTRDSASGTLDDLIPRLGSDDVTVCLSARHAKSFSRSLNELAPFDSFSEYVCDGRHTKLDMT
jgi:hypothetical protein